MWSDACQFCRALDFFLLFFTTEVMTTACENTDKYAWMNIVGKPILNAMAPGRKLFHWRCCD